MFPWILTVTTEKKLNWFLAECKLEMGLERPSVCMSWSTSNAAVLHKITSKTTFSPFTQTLLYFNDTMVIQKHYTIWLSILFNCYKKSKTLEYDSTWSYFVVRLMLIQQAFIYSVSPNICTYLIPKYHRTA